MFLRQWNATDAAALLDLARTSTGLERQMPLPTCLEEAKNLIEKNWLSAEDRAVFCIDDGQAAGLISVAYTAKDDEGNWDRGWVSYWTADRLRGQGITKHAVKVVCDWALGQVSINSETEIINTNFLNGLHSPNLRRLELGYRTNNPASGAIAAFAGFVIEGVEREKFLYGGDTFDAVNASRLRDSRADEIPSNAEEQAAAFKDKSAAFHHLELWTENFEEAFPSWTWLLSELGFKVLQHWPNGISWEAPDGSYLVLEESPDVSGPHERTKAGLNHLALRVDSVGLLEELRLNVSANGWNILFAEKYPNAGGPDHFALYLENTEGFEVEIVAAQD